MVHNIYPMSLQESNSPTVSIPKKPPPSSTLHPQDLTIAQKASKSQDDEPKRKIQLQEVGQYLCRILFAKCHSQDPTVAAVALASIGHILNDNNLAPLLKDLPEFEKEFMSAFENAKMNNVSYLHVTPNFTGFHLENTDFSGSQFQKGARFDQAIIGGAKFTKSTLVNVTFVESQSEPTKPEELRGPGALGPADFSEANCKNCSFEDADIPGALFSGATLTNCTFTARRNPSNFTAARFTAIQSSSPLTFDNFDLTKALFGNTEDIAAIFNKCTLVEANFIDANFNQPRFSGGRAHLARFGAKALGHEGAEANPTKPVFDSMSLVSADLGRCDFLAYDELQNSVCIDNARISSTSSLKKTLETITHAKLQTDRKLTVGNHGWIVVVERTDNEIGATTKYRLIGCLVPGHGGDPSTKAFALESGAINLLTRIRIAAAQPGYPQLFPSIQDDILTNEQVSAQENNIFKMNDDALKTEIQRRWSLNLDTPPEKGIAQSTTYGP